MSVACVLERAKKVYSSPARKNQVSGENFETSYCVGGALMLAADDLGLKTPAGRVGYPTKSNLVSILQLLNPSLDEVAAGHASEGILGFNDGGSPEESWDEAMRAVGAH
jgi:hypothetical protein